MSGEKKPGPEPAGPVPNTPDQPKGEEKRPPVRPNEPPAETVPPASPPARREGIVCDPDHPGS